MERAWILYDVGNSAFVLVVVTAVLPIFFKQYAAGTMAPAASTALWGYATGFATLLVAVLALVLGPLADRPGRRLPVFAGCLACGLAGCLGLVFIRQGGWLWCLLLYVAGRVGWGTANVVYDGFLPLVTGPSRYDRLSAHGYAWGYLGSLVPFAVVLVLLAGSTSGLDPARVRLAFLVVATWWLAFALPLFRHGRGLAPAAGQQPKDPGWRALAAAWRQPVVRRFLLAYFCYIDGVGTVISMATAYGTDIGLGHGTLLAAILAIQLVACPATLAAGRLADRFGVRLPLFAGIGVYLVITGVGFFLPAVGDSGNRQLVFWVLAILVALAMGPVQSLSRSLFARLVPAGESGAWFGLFNLFGRFATVLGPVLMGAATSLGGDSRYGLLAVLALLATGGLLLAGVGEGR